MSSAKQSKKKKKYRDANSMTPKEKAKQLVDKMKFKTKRYSVEYCIKNNIAIRCRTTLEWMTVGQIFERNNVPFGSLYGGFKISERKIEDCDDICLSTAVRGDKTFGYAPTDFFIKEGCGIINCHNFVQGNMQQKNVKLRMIQRKSC